MPVISTRPPAIPSLKEVMEACLGAIASTLRSEAMSRALQNQVHEKTLVESHIVPALRGIAPGWDVYSNYEQMGPTELNAIRQAKMGYKGLWAASMGRSPVTIIDKPIVPDVVLHSVGEAGPNILAIEVKRSSNTVAADHEKDRDTLLSCLTHSKLKYCYAMHLIIRTDGSLDEPFIASWFVRGPQSDEGQVIYPVSKTYPLYAARKWRLEELPFNELVVPIGY